MPIDMSVWQGRCDPEDGDLGLRWHQRIVSAEDANQKGIMLLGFACDEGVTRNKGRTGAYDAPVAIRKALANLAWHHQEPIYDGGDISCNDGNLEQAQHRLGEDVSRALRQKHKVIVLGGGHEVAWGTFQGLAHHLSQKQGESTPRIGIINFDAHFDLRNLGIGKGTEYGSSGTPFQQIARHCELQNWPFRYACLGVSRASNTQALFAKADRLGVLYKEDTQLTYLQLEETIAELQAFMLGCDYLYLTIDMDVFPASVAPGVSAPAARGVSAEVVEILVNQVLKAKNRHGKHKLLVADIAEYNPRFDIDNQTARLAARLTWTIARAFRK